MLTLSANAQEEALNTILKQELSVRQTEELVKRMSGQKLVSKKKTRRSPNVSDVETRLQSSLGTRVSLKHNKSGRGTVTIYYYSNEDLDTLLEKLT
jgi:ParB family chromosome partitioning protein